jgi:hypothetical protein
LNQEAAAVGGVAAAVIRAQLGHLELQPSNTQTSLTTLHFNTERSLEFNTLRTHFCIVE